MGRQNLKYSMKPSEDNCKLLSYAATATRTITEASGTTTNNGSNTSSLHYLVREPKKCNFNVSSFHPTNHPFAHNGSASPQNAIAYTCIAFPQKIDNEQHSNSLNNIFVIVIHVNGALRCSDDGGGVARQCVCVRTRCILTFHSQDNCKYLTY